VGGGGGGWGWCDSENKHELIGSGLAWKTKTNLGHGVSERDTVELPGTTSAGGDGLKGSSPRKGFRDIGGLGGADGFNTESSRGVRNDF